MYNEIRDGEECLFRVMFSEYAYLFFSGLGGDRLHRSRVTETPAAPASTAPRLGREGGQPGSHLLREPQQPHHAVEETQ